MEWNRIEISSWTASFRYPNIISGFQPTLTVPPISTVLGLINAAAGSYLDFRDVQIGYFFQYEMKGIDLETIYQFGDKGKINLNPTSNVIRREFLFNTNLFIYLKDESIISLFKKPYYPLVLGRSNDIASVRKIKNIALDKIENANKVKGQIVPFKNNFLPGTIQALPKYFTDEIPRNNLGTEPFTIIGYDAPDVQTRLTTLHDNSLLKNGVDIFIHNITY